ncbi:F-box domain [Macleaya cordata]|uniref:F-box domain n=1 Tax=Macleaya cordata TaxID=56857 RepID=A0A200Q1P9_MACCD|nr:F-box domain [Macleaya cordata]
MVTMEGKRNSISKNYLNNKQRPNWSDLPYDLLERIAVRLSLRELLSFRSACKQWRLASSKASGEIHASDETNSSEVVVWLLLYGNDPNCRLYDISCDKMYTIDFPELYGANCIASNGGWLLLYRNGGSMFFFCPFSRAKIDLPKFSHDDEEELMLMSHIIATFSSAPTYPDCIVCVVGTKIISTHHQSSLELNVLRRGASEWVKYKYDKSENLKNVFTYAVLCDDEILYLLDSKLLVLIFSLQDEKWLVRFIIPDDVIPDPSRVVGTIPFQSKREECTDQLKQKLGLKESDSLTTCGTTIQGSDSLTCIHNQDIQGDDEDEFSHKKGVWIQPRFFQLPANQTWSL